MRTSLERLALIAMLAGCGRWSFDERHDANSDSVSLDAPPDPGVVELSVRGSAACVRTGEGRIACWGSNAHGQLGRGSIATTGVPQIVALDNIANVVTGEFDTFAIDRDGALWGWGGNAAGQLGLGSIGLDEPSPIRVPVPEPVAAVASGQFHTCAITAGLGELYCWGGNACGGLGTGDQVEHLSPTKVAGLTGLTAIAMHDYETCVIDAGGTALCFGAVYDASCTAIHLTPTAPIGLPPVREVQGGCHMSMCAIDTSGGAWCWGDSNAGNLGDGSATRHLDPLPVATISGVTTIGTGYDVSCAATSTTAYCWGGNTVGQLGIGTPAITETPTPLALPFFGQQLVDQVEVGCSTVCARSGHDVFCWGENEGGVIDGTTLDAFAPRQISLPL